MIYLNDISLSFGDRQLLDGISFMLSHRHRAGLIGKNGAGKSTLFKIIHGELTPDSGRVEMSKEYTLGYLKQDINFQNEISVIDEAKKAFSQIKDLENRISKINEKLAEFNEFESVEYSNTVQQLSDYIHRLELLDAANADARAVKVLKGLGFKDEEFQRPLFTFSGGWNMRVEMAKLLLQKPDLLLLDEPTNHLDIPSIVWLEQYLQTYPGVVIIISHDKMFLDNTCNKILELELGQLNVYEGNYSKYLVEKEKQKEVISASFENQQKLIRQKERTINRFMAKATKTKMAQSMQKQLDKIERIEIPEQDNARLSLRFQSCTRPGRVIFDINNLSMSFGEKQIFSQIDMHVERGDKIALVGKNGEGKSTFVKLITGELIPATGKIQYGTNVQVSYYAQDQPDTLDRNKTVLEIMEDESPAEQRPNLRKILGAFLFSGEDVEKKVAVLSGGERSRLALARMLLRPSNVIILDEPTNHLDIATKDVLKDALLNYDGTLIVISHDREFLDGLSNKVYEFDNGRVREYLGDINYFLEKKQYLDIRDIQISDSTNLQVNAAIQPENPKVSLVDKKLSHEEEKKLKRRVQYLERDIEQLESLISIYEARSSDNDFYQSSSYLEETKEYQENKIKLEELLEEWERLAIQIE